MWTGHLETGTLLCGKQNSDGHTRASGVGGLSSPRTLSLWTSKCYWPRELNGELLFCKPGTHSEGPLQLLLLIHTLSRTAAMATSISTPIVIHNRDQHQTPPLPLCSLHTSGVYRFRRKSMWNLIKKTAFY